MTTIIPGAVAPFCIEDGSVVRVGEAFLKRKPTEPSGVPRGELPWRLFASFLGAEKGGGQQARPILQGVLEFVRAYKPLS